MHHKEVTNKNFTFAKVMKNSHRTREILTLFVNWTLGYHSPSTEHH